MDLGPFLHQDMAQRKSFRQSHRFIITLLSLLDLSLLSCFRKIQMKPTAFRPPCWESFGKKRARKQGRSGLTSVTRSGRHLHEVPRRRLLVGRDLLLIKNSADDFSNADTPLAGRGQEPQKWMGMESDSLD